MRIWPIIAGALALLGGILALMNPFAATLTAEQMAGWIFIFVGILEIVAIFSSEGGWSKVLSGVLGLIFLLTGISLLANPITGIVSLTIVVAALFLAGGIFKIVFAFMGGIKPFWPLALSGALSLVLAFLIFSNFPASAVTILGVLLAVELIASGVSLIMLGMTKDAERA